MKLVRDRTLSIGTKVGDL